MKINKTKSGFTLTELLVALGISGIIGLFAARQLWTAIRFSGHTQESFELEKAKVSVLMELKKVMSRSRRVATTGGGAGFLVDVPGSAVNGAITFAADLRPCAAGGAAAAANQFNPLDAAASGLPPTGAPGVITLAARQMYTLVTFLCCPPPATPTVNVASPFGGNIVAINRCRTRSGLSINYRRNGVDLGGACYGNFGTTGASFTGMRFQQVDLDYSTIRLIPSDLCDKDGNLSSTSYYSPYWCGPGSTPKTCPPAGAGCLPGSTSAPNGLYYGAFITSDTFTAGNDQRNQQGTNGINAVGRDTLRVAADIATTTEFYGRLENHPDAHIFDCSSGVPD